MLKTSPKIKNDEKSPEYVNKLKKELEFVENKNREFNSKQIINENKLKKSKEKLIGQLFEMMKENGVDPSNIESINSFLRKLEEQDPDLLILFEAIFNNITGNDVLPEGQEKQVVPLSPETSLPNEQSASIPPGYPLPAEEQPTPVSPIQ